MPRLVERFISPLAGLASEAVAHQRRKSQTRSSQPQPQDIGNSRPEELDLPDYESEDEHWELDDAAEEVHARQIQSSQVPKGNWMSPASIDTIVTSFLMRHPPKDATAGSRLALPVVIPQKRPQKKDRGFVRAYSPVLEDCGIDQATWLEFLDSFHESIKVSPVFNIINVSMNTIGMATLLVPSASVHAAHAVIVAAEMIAKETYTRSRTNTFMVEMNEKYFKPQGLYCLMVTYKPDSTSIVETLDVNDMVSKAQHESEGGGSGGNPARSAPTAAQAENAALNEKLKRTLKLWTGRSSAISRGEAQMPVVAPLIYPDLENVSDAQKQNWFSRGMTFTTDYFDKRAVAQWRTEHSDTTLTGLTPAPEFLTARGDPSNTRPHTSMLTALTGRESRLATRRRVRRDVQQDRRNDQWEARAESGSGVRGLVAKATKGKPPIVAVKRMLKVDVVYMMLVRLPSSADADDQ